MELLANIASLAGSFMIILAYYLISSEKMSNKDARYQWLNLVGAVLILCSLYHYWNIGTFIIEIFWIIIAVSALWKMKRSSK